MSNITFKKRYNIIKYNVKECYKNILLDFRIAKTISMVIDKLDEVKPNTVILSKQTIEEIEKVRTLAKTYYTGEIYNE